MLKTVNVIITNSVKQILLLSSSKLPFHSATDLFYLPT